MSIRIYWDSIYKKLLTTYVALTVLGTSVLAGYILFSLQNYFLESRQDDLTTWASALTESVADALEVNDLARVKVLVKRYGASDTITLRIFNSSGRLLFSSNPDLDNQITNWLTVQGISEGLQNQATQGITKGVITNDDRLYASQPIFRNGQLLGVLRISITLKQFQQKFATVVWAVLWAVLFTVFICALISDWFARTISSPIKVMRNFAIRVGSGHLGDKLNIRQGDELGQLATELNRMSARLASLDQERRAFLANVSHELRTPVSNVQVTAEALRSGAYQDPELRDRFFQTIEDETKRLARLIHDLLDLGRLEAGVTSLEKQQIDLQLLIEQAVRAMEPRMLAKGISIQLNVMSIKLEGDPERLLQVLLNILDNAIKHSLPHSKILICNYIDGNQAAIDISDRGAGISETDMPHIFEQFYTADPSRQGSGTGLGLAIARRIVEAHEGNITANSILHKGTNFLIRLPLIGKQLSQI